MKETKEEFLARYPKPSNAEKRYLSQCSCDYEDCAGWVWAWRREWECEGHEMIQVTGLKICRFCDYVEFEEN